MDDLLLLEILKDIRADVKQLCATQTDILVRIGATETSIIGIEQGYNNHITDMKAKADRALTWKIALVGVATVLGIFALERISSTFL